MSEAFARNLILDRINHIEGDIVLFPLLERMEHKVEHGLSGLNGREKAQVIDALVQSTSHNYLADAVVNHIFGNIARILENIVAKSFEAEHKNVAL